MKPLDDETLEARTMHAMAGGDWPTATMLGRILDGRDADRHRQQREMLDVRLLDAALWYAAHGQPVFPLQPGSKIPRPGSRGFKDATCDEDRITAWWRSTPRANVGLPTGHLFDVIDLDGTAGIVSWLRSGSDLPPMVGLCSTPRPGGLHLYVATEPELGCGTGILPSVDYRSVGGYVVAPPSRILPGDGVENPGCYDWVHLPALLGGIS